TAIRCTRHKHTLIPFPTRRSSDLEFRADAVVEADPAGHLDDVGAGDLRDVGDLVDEGDLGGQEGVGGKLDHLGAGDVGAHQRGRSEEHTSELQSLAYLVCRLLLEK